MKKTVFFLLYLFCANALYAQDIAPSQQAQGVIGNKNVIVDHATGLFYYKVPLYTLRSGNFQLPVSLDYVGKGVKEEDKRGLIDYNWTLNTGGVVTRTIRGGVADEADGGYASVEASFAGQTPLSKDIVKVNRRLRDGESDIFTAMFGGQKIDFIIRMDKEGKIYTEPLECTNIRVECEFVDFPVEITGWIITDENGNRYFYRQKEWSSYINKEDAITFNGIRNKSYVSSWYLNRIEPLNGEPILFNYKEDVWSEGEQSGIRTTKVYTGYMSKYVYGSPIREHTFDFSLYEKDFDRAINNACACLENFSWETQINNQKYLWNGNTNWVYNPNFEVGVEAVSNNFRIMGQLANFSKITQASNELLQLLNKLYDMYRDSPSSNARMAAAYFNEAKNYVVECLKGEVQFVNTRETSNITCYEIRSPLLESIHSKDRIIEFCYIKEWPDIFLSGVKLCDVQKNRISEIRISNGYWETFNRLSFLDKDSVEINTMKFDYYSLPSEKYMYDNWGYVKRINNYQDEQYEIDADSVYSKSLSLKKITLPNGGSVIVDYEPNTINRKRNILYTKGDWFTEKFGGLRIKSLVFDGGKEGCSDTVLYSYPLLGEFVNGKYFNRELIRYARFSDEVWYSMGKYSGHAFLNMGNSGIYYPYVQEIVKNKGIRAYLFHVPKLRRRDRVNEPYAFWIYGLPLGIAEYDCNGNLKRIVKNIYYAGQNSLTSDYLNLNESYFVRDNDTIFNYSRKLPQMKVYEYYMDADFLSSYYSSQRKILLYNDRGSSKYFVPYDDVYLPNIAPRTSVVLPDQYYELYYGGKTLLKEQLEYRFEGQVTNCVAYEDFYIQTKDTLFQKVEYFYDNKAMSVKPTRVEKSDACGDIYTTVIKRVTEMDESVDPFIAQMKRLNLVDPVIKQLELKNNILLEETVFRYKVYETDSIYHARLTDQYLYFPETSEGYSVVAVDNSLFTHEEAKYMLINTSKYEQNRHSYLCIGVNKRGGRTFFSYDFGGNQRTLKAENADLGTVFSVDLRKYRKLLADMPLGSLDVCDYASKFMSWYSKFIPEGQSSSYLNYRNSPEHASIIHLLEILSDLTVSSDYHVVKEMLDSVRTNISLALFRTMYMGIIRAGQIPDFTPKELMSLIKYIDSPDIINEAFFDQFNIIHRMSNAKSLWKNSVPESGYLKLYVLTSGGGGHIGYSIVHSGGTLTGNISLDETLGYNVQSFQIDLTSYEGEISVSIEKDSQIDYIVLVPEGVTFEASSYNLDGTVFCTFDQTGRLEMNEYDRACRLIRVKDGAGNVVKEINYHLTNQ